MCILVYTDPWLLFIEVHYNRYTLYIGTLNVNILNRTTLNYHPVSLAILSVCVYIVETTWVNLPTKHAMPAASQYTVKIAVLMLLLCTYMCVWERDVSKNSGKWVKITSSRAGSGILCTTYH